jgi:hypothetical protein
MSKAHCIGTLMYIRLGSHSSRDIFSSNLDDVSVGVDERGRQRWLHPLV